MTVAMLSETFEPMITVLSLNAALATRIRLGPGPLNQDAQAEQAGVFVADKATNAFRTVQTLRPGVHRLCIALGGHVGRAIEAELKREGLPHESLWLQSESRRTVVVEREPAFTQWEWKGPRRVPASDLRSLARVVPQRVGRGDLVLIAGSLPAGPPLKSWNTLFRRIQTAGGRICLDSSQTRELLALGISPWLVKVNRREWGGRKGLVADARREVEARGLIAAIVTDGPRGATAVTADGAWRVRPAKRMRGWAVGCGDAFCGGLLEALDRGIPMPEALVQATACALANLRSPIHGEVRLRDVQRARREVRVAQIA